MRMKPKTLAGLIILFLFLAMIPPVSGNGWPEEQTRHIQAPPVELGKDTDMFVTGSGLGFSSTLVTVLDPNMDIYGYLFFKDMKMNSYFFLENATLRLHTASTLSFDNESSFTIYGIPDYRYFGMGDWGYGSPAEIINAPLTSAHVNYNSSQFYGSQWHDIDVTNIVQELKSNPWYEGPGVSFYDEGDYMAFIILGPSGSDSRWFYDLSAGNGYEAQLHLHWDFSPPPPSGYEDAIFNETYGNFTIWEILGAVGYDSFDPMEYLFVEGTGAPYDLMFDTIHTAPGTPVSITQSASVGMGDYVSQRKLVRASNGTIFATYFNTTHIYVEKSHDEGATWIDGPKIDTYPGMDFDQWNPSIAIDSEDNLHVVWWGEADGYVEAQIWYALNNGTWNTPVWISNYTGMISYPQTAPAIAVDSEDNLHVVWYGLIPEFGPTDSQIWYALNDGTWNAPVRISTKTGMSAHPQTYPSIAVAGDNSLHVAWHGGTVSDAAQIQYAEYNGATWLEPVHISTLPNMSHGSTTAIAVGPDESIQIAYRARVTDIAMIFNIYFSKRTGGWADPLLIGTYAGMVDYEQWNPSIAIGSDYHTQVLWHGKATGYTTQEIVWYAEYTDSWAPPEPLQPIGQNIEASLRWNRFPAPLENSTYVVADDNGTVLIDDLDSVDDAKDWIDGVDPDPEDPDPAGVWSEGPGGETGAFTRFRMRLWFLIIGFGCFFGPILFFSWKRPSGYYLMAGSIVMLIGLGLLMSIAQV